MSLYIVLENQDPGFDPHVNGNALSRAEEQLAVAATKLSVRPLMEFFSISPDEAGEFLEEDEVQVAKLPPLQWFSAEEGLKTVRALLQEYGDKPEFAKIKAELLEFEHVLKQAQVKGIRWHLAVDY